MKNPIPRRVVSPFTYFLSSLLLLLCILLPARAQDLTLNANIGSSVSGSDSYLSGTYAVTATGVGCGFGHYDTSDNIHFVYAQKTGDVELVVRVASFTNPNEGQVGLVLRSGLGTADPSASGFFFSNHVYDGGQPPVNCFAGVDRQATFDSNPYYYELQGGGFSTHPLVSPPFWLKMVKVGDNYGFYWSQDGRNWLQISNTSGGAFFAAGTFDIGLFVGSGSTTTSATATFDNVYLGSPRLKYKTSWVGATSAGIAAGNPSNGIYSMWVKPDGACYTNSSWDESGMAGKIYKDGKVFHGFFGSGINGAFEGTVTGNGTNIFYYNGVPTPRVCYTDFTTYVSPWGPGVGTLSFAGTLGQVRGLAASATTIFVSDYGNGLVRIVDASTHAETYQFSLPRCGPIAYDGTNFWIIQAATQDDSSHGLSSHTVGTYAPSIRCFAPTGVEVSPSRTISWTSPDTCIPTALAYQDIGTAGTTADDILWVCDNSPHQNIRRYTNVTGTPSATTAFGQDGGIWAGAAGHAGLISDSTAGGDQRFYGPVGVGTDSSGNIYVACNGGEGATTDVRKFNSAGTMQWRVNGLTFIHNGDFDPSTGGADYYTPEKHFTMNYANTAPGSEWSYQGFTRDIRNESAARDCGVKLARVGGNLIMYTKAMGNVGTMRFYCFNGETATFFGTNAMDGTAPNTHRIWIDANLNGTVDSGEDTSVPQPSLGGEIMSFDVDSAGDIWMCGGGNVRQVVNQGTQTVTNGTMSNVVPKYSLASGGYYDYAIPAPLTTATQIAYDRVNDALYLVGQTTDGTWMLVRTDQWRTNPENKTTPTATWAVKLLQKTDVSILLPGSLGYFAYFGLDVAGGKAFVSEVFGPIHVYDTALGNEEITLVPGPELSARSGWDDMTMGVTAFQRSSGEFLVTEEDAGFNASDLLYRWTPAADTIATIAPVLTASASGRKVILSWAGPMGMVTSYKLYRGTSSGGETLYQSGITSPTFTDLNVTPGTAYYYKVTAVNAAGESAQSNEASATPASSQAEYVKTDTTTQGNWYTGSVPADSYVYGSDGYEICGHATSYPTYATVTSAAPSPTPATTTTTGIWAATTSDVRALRKPASSTDRIAAYRQRSDGSAYPWSWTVDVGTGWHQVALYLLDWGDAADHYAAPTTRDTHQVKIYDMSSGTRGALLDYRRVGDFFTQGKYLVWNITGKVEIEISQFGYHYNTVASGLFFDPVHVPTPTIGWWKLDETSGIIGSDSSGAGHNMSCGLTAGSWDSSGKIGGCFNMSGGSGASFPASIFTPLNDRTFCTWLKTTISAPILGEQGSGFAPLLYIGTDGKLYGSFNTGTITPMVSSATTLKDNTWHHVALTRSGNVQTMYLDGAVAGTLVAPNIADYSASQMGSSYITGWPNLTNTNYAGKFDDVRIYDKALTPGQIYRLANP